LNDAPPLPRVATSVVDAFGQALLAGDGSDAGLLVEELLADGLPAETLMMDLLAPAARLLGGQWCDDRIDFVAVTLGLSRIQQVLRRLRMPAPPHGESRGRVLLVPVPGEQHSFGLRLVEEMLRRDGWRVTVALAVSELDICTKISTENYDIIGFSISGTRLIPALGQTIRRVRAGSRNPLLRIMVGGVALAGGGVTAAEIGADAIVADARAAVVEANRWLADMLALGEPA
jgi:methanogenic corrinoid protein MtbC1